MRFFFMMLVAALLVTGCTTKAKARSTAQKAYVAGRRGAAVEAQQSGVFIRGDVRNPLVKWHEGLTLSHALLAAEYHGNGEPRAFVLSRNGETLSVDPEDLIAGKVDPIMQPGDVVEIKK